MKLFLVALAVRIAWLLAFPCEPRCYDSSWYFTNAAWPFPALRVPYEVDGFSIASVWGLNPGQVAWTWIFHPVVGFANAVAGALTCVLVNRMVGGAGWLLAFWPSHIFATALVLKWIPAGLAITASWFVIRKRLWLALPLVPANYLLFWNNGVGNIGASDLSPWYRMAGVWAPVLGFGNLDLSIVVQIPLLFAAVVGICLACVWVRRVQPWHFGEIALVLVFTAGAALTRDSATYRIPIEPLLLMFGWRAMKEIPGLNPATARSYWIHDEWEADLA